jgi:hypothetical protein
MKALEAGEEINTYSFHYVNPSLYLYIIYFSSLIHLSNIFGQQIFITLIGDGAVQGSLNMM